MTKMPVEVSRKISKISFVCAIFVVMLHVGIGPNWIDRLWAVKGIAVPFFFVIAGYLFAGRMDDLGWYFRQLKSRASSLLLPYVFWNLMYWCFVYGLTFALRKIGVRYGAIETLDALMWRRWDVFGLNLFAFPAMGLLWFVRCLMANVLVSPFYLVFSRRWSAILLLLGYGGMVWFDIAHPIPRSNWVGIWLAKGWLMSMFYFGAGVWVRFNGGETLKIPRVVGVLSLCVGWVMLACVSGAAYFVGVLVAMWGLWYSLSEAAWPKWLTGNSFPIYVLHIFWCAIVAATFNILGVKAWAECSAFAWVIKWLIMVGGSIVTALVLKKVLPRVFSVVFGGR